MGPAAALYRVICNSDDRYLATGGLFRVDLPLRGTLRDLWDLGDYLERHCLSFCVALGCLIAMGCHP